GLDSFGPLGDGKDYFEVNTRFSQGKPILHQVQQYELDIVDLLNVELWTDPLRAWLMYGAIREDDNTDEDPPTPHDIFPPISRPLSHFYDPIADRALHSPALVPFQDEIRKAPDWAIGSADSFSNPNTPESPRNNTFTIFDAREAMFRALTLQSFDGGAYSDVAGTENAATRHQLRRMYWSSTFRALGDVLHMNQDMAQPQHTRNEPHAGKYCIGYPTCPGGHSSVYEKYVNARVLSATSFDLRQPYNKAIGILPVQIAAGTYPIPNFAKYTDYWSTASGMSSVTGKGLANYSNQGFFTAGKNFDSHEYPSPPQTIDAYAVRTLTPPRWDGTLSTDPTPTYVFNGQVRDAWQGSIASDVPLTTLSLWDQFLEKRGALPAYSLNRVNYDAMADLLIPRAVSYSAGLINYFFRGRLEITRPDDGVFALADHADPKGFTKIRAKVRNQTPDFVTPDGVPQVQSMDGGDLIAVIRYHKDLKYVPGLDTVVGVEPCIDPLVVIVEKNSDTTTECRDGAEQIIVSPPIAGVSIGHGSDLLVEFDFSGTPIPFGVTDVILQVVYRGALGGETNAIAVGSVDLSEPTYFTYHNASDYVRIGDHVYTRPEVEQDLDLLAQVQPRYCVDERTSPPLLRPECLLPFTIDLAVAFDDLSEPLAVVAELPQRRFVRFAYLTVASEGFDPPVKAARSRQLKVEVRRHASAHKAQLQQDGTCLPHDPFNATPRVMQVTHITWQQFAAPVSRMQAMRGVNGWINASCVIDGSGVAPGTPDDREQVMEPLTTDSEEITPVPMTIMAKYLGVAN
ncbi:MAG: hypothetical protein ACREX6_06825, partial [Casimicrobiaceae bacterium]